MDKLKNNKTILGVTFFSIGIVILILIIVFLSINSNKTFEENTLYKTILITNTKVSDAFVIEQEANDYYSEASYSYEKKDYKSVESNCRLARTDFSQASQDYKDIESSLKNSGIKDTLIDIYSNELSLASEINLNLYEACEHFESAARYYNTYYDLATPYDDPSYDMGTSEMNAMNEKIDLHDTNVRKYNELLADFKAEMERRLK